MRNRNTITERRNKREEILEIVDRMMQIQHDRIVASFFLPGQDVPSREDVMRRYRFMRLGPARHHAERLHQESRGRV